MGRRKSTRPVASKADIEKAQDIIKDYNKTLRETYGVYAKKDTPLREYMELGLQNTELKTTPTGLLSYDRKNLQDPDILRIVNAVDRKVLSTQDVENVVKANMESVNKLRSSLGLDEIDDYDIYEEIQGMAYARITTMRNQKRMNYFSNASGEYAEATELLDTNDILNVPGKDASEEKKKAFARLKIAKEQIENDLATMRENHQANRYSTFYIVGKKMEDYKRNVNAYLAMV